MAGAEVRKAMGRAGALSVWGIGDDAAECYPYNGHKGRCARYRDNRPYATGRKRYRQYIADISAVNAVGSGDGDGDGTEAPAVESMVRFAVADASAASPTISMPAKTAAHPLRRLQARANARESRRLHEDGASIGSTASRSIAGALSEATGAVASLVSAASVQAASLLIPMLIPVLAAIAILSVLPTCTATLTLLPQGTGGAAVARAALSEYRVGEESGSYGHGEQKYWNRVFGGGFVNGYQTPWCACFVSWCADEAGSVGQGLVPVLGGCGGFLEWYASHPDAGTVYHGFAGYFPQVGDFIIYNSTGGPGIGHDHIGIVSRVHDDGSFDTVEGNTYAPHSSMCGLSDNHCGIHYHQRVGDGWPSADRTGNGRGGGEPSFIRPAYAASGMGEIAIPEYSSGTCPVGHSFENVPVGTYATREWDLAENSFAAGTAQARVQALWRSAGSVTDSAGFTTLDGCYLIACTSAFGDVGDRITFYFDDGTAIECVKVDAKAESVAAHDGHPATRWGHAHDANVLEFCGTDAIGDDPYLALGLDGRRVVSATNHGSIL